MTFLEEKPVQKLLTKREYGLFLRFGVGPFEKPNAAEKKECAAVLDKIEAEQRRAAEAERDYFIRCAETFEGVASKESDGAERKRLVKDAKEFRRHAAALPARVDKRVRDWRAKSAKVFKTDSRRESRGSGRRPARNTDHRPSRTLPRP